MTDLLAAACYKCTEKIKKQSIQCCCIVAALALACCLFPGKFTDGVLLFAGPDERGTNVRLSWHNFNLGAKRTEGVIWIKCRISENQDITKVITVYGNLYPLGGHEGECHPERDGIRGTIVKVKLLDLEVEPQKGMYGGNSF